MKVAVMGAGAVGCYYGGLLAQAGHDVVLIGRHEHVAAMNRNGLVLERAQGLDVVSVRASTDVAALADAELVLCCVKSPDTLACAHAMVPALSAHARVLSLQNGVENAPQLSHVLGRVVEPVVVYVAVGMVGAGHVRHYGRGELVMSATALTSTQKTAFSDAGIALQFSDEVVQALWGKLVINCSFNALSAITQMSYGPLWQGEGIPALLHILMEECRAVAQAEGVRLPDDLWETIASIPKSMPDQISSTAQDLKRGRPTEIAHLNGYIVRTGLAHGIPVPANQTLASLVVLLEQGKSH